MRVLITRYPASEDRLIVRPLLCRRCALRLQPAEPQPYKYWLNKRYHPTHPTKGKKLHFKSTWLPLESQWQGTNALNKGRQEGPRLQNPT